MDSSFRLSALLLTAAILTVVVKKQSPELSLVLTLSACTVGSCLLFSLLKPVMQLAAGLAARAELEDRLMAPLWKCLGLGLLTEVTASVCSDAGQTALAKVAELGGSLLCLVVSLPLLQAVLALIEELL